MTEKRQFCTTEETHVLVCVHQGPGTQTCHFMPAAAGVRFRWHEKVVTSPVDGKVYPETHAMAAGGTPAGKIPPIPDTYQRAKTQ